MAIFCQRGNLGATDKDVVMKGHWFKSWKQPLV